MHRARPLAPSLFAFALFYGGMVCIAGVLGNKQVSLGPLSAIGTAIGIGPLAVEAGIFGFLLLVVLSSAIAELHGQNTATFLVRLGFIPLLVSAALIHLVLALPHDPGMYPPAIDAFPIVVGQSARISSSSSPAMTPPRPATMSMAGTVSFGRSGKMSSV